MYELSVTKKVYETEADVETVAVTVSPPDGQTGVSSQLIIKDSADVSVKLGDKFYLLSADEYTPPEETTGETETGDGQAV